MRSRRLFLCVLLCGVLLNLEAAGLRLLLVAEPERQRELLLLHPFLCALFALALQTCLPPRYRAQPALGFALFFALAFFVPVLGALGLLFGLLPALALPDRAEGEEDAGPPAAGLPLPPVPMLRGAAMDTSPAAARRLLSWADATVGARERVLPYLAEAAYRRGDFEEVRDALDGLDPGWRRTQPLLRALSAYWVPADGSGTAP